MMSDVPKSGSEGVQGTKSPIRLPSKEATRGQSNAIRKRVYKTVSTETLADGGGTAVLLDGRRALSAGKRPLVLPSRALAEALAAEWDSQEETIKPETMPLTSLVNTALDGVSDRADDVRAELRRYGGSDLLCYRADGPEALVARQAAAWQPILDWADAQYGVSLQVTAGLMPVPQTDAVLARLADILHDVPVWPLTALQAVTASSGSLMLALALFERRLGGAEVAALSMLDDTWQEEQWGSDAEAAQRRATVAADILAAERFLMLVREA